MGNDWRTATVLELQKEGVLLVEDGNHGEYRPRPNEFVDDGVAFIRAADMDGGRVMFTRASRINETARRRISKGIGAGGDILLSHKGTVGKVALVPDDSPPFVCSPQTTFWRTLMPKVLNRRYLHAFLRSPNFHQQLRSRSGETDMAPYVSLTAQRGFTVTIPPIEIQRFIADAIGSLDDKIELNRRMNETLEAMAQALFKSWFIDFDPVRAKMAGHTPTGRDAATAALFPDGFDQFSLRPVPRGWQIVPLGDVLELKRGYDLPAADRRPGDVPIVSSSGPSGYHNEAKVRGPGVVTGRYGTLGEVFLVWEDFWPLNTALYVQDFKGSDPLFASYLLRNVDFEKFSDKGAVPGINRNHVHTEPVCAAPVPVQCRFSELIHPWLSLVRENQVQSDTLARLRDTLLPHLLSGDLREREVEKVA
jgi:type I restriction enzyme, S subunit